MTTIREIHVAVGTIFRSGKVLIARRPEHVHQGGLLEFPGGKVEADETVQQALVREILEETGLRIAADDLEPVIEVRHDYGDKRVYLDVWRALSADGEAHGREGQEIRWLDVSELNDADFPVANRPIIRALRLPDHYAITGSAQSEDAFVDRFLAGMSQAGPDLCLLRAPGLNEEAYARRAQWALEQCNGRHSRLMLHGAPSLLGRFPEACGLHLPWAEARQLSARPCSGDYLLAVSCHTAEEIAHAEQLQADFITLGPVKPTPSHPGVSGMGWRCFRELVAGATVPVYALGGLGLADVSKARSTGAQGVAGISFWWPGN
ncbi:Nudix family hydrolase [Marinobacter sp. HL-58]|uniref:Nudix family hydrolase n=1 Tax=Marinobacter sp. HL-58 TaxID=1479237 RepID=UPI0006DBD2D5|nr:Nudix family hydrolase [Marinobacter sp. HL-58]KPP98271.1 MAG: 8-oxo-dGTP diphosphatase [Marinobacter sp. HL-58]